MRTAAMPSVGKHREHLGLTWGSLGIHNEVRTNSNNWDLLIFV